MFKWSCCLICVPFLLKNIYTFIFYCPEVDFLSSTNAALFIAYVCVCIGMSVYLLVMANSSEAWCFSVQLVYARLLGLSNQICQLYRTGLSGTFYRLMECYFTGCVVADIELSVLTYWDTLDYWLNITQDASLLALVATLHTLCRQWLKCCCVLSVSCLYKPSSVLTHDFTGGLLPVKQQKTVTFNFYPADPIAYRETVTFEINGLTQQSIEIKGKGAQFKVVWTFVTFDHQTYCSSIAYNPHCRMQC